MIPAAFRWKLGARVAGDVVPELTVLTVKGAGRFVGIACDAFVLFLEWLELEVLSGWEGSYSHCCLC